MSEFRNMRANDSASINDTNGNSAFTSIGGDELGKTRNLSIGERRELEQIFNPKETSKSALLEDFFIVQSKDGKKSKDDKEEYEVDDFTPRGITSKAALKAAKKDPLLAPVIKALDAKGAKEGQKEADQVVKALTKKYGKNSKEVAQVLLELGAAFQSKKHIDIAKAFYVQGVDTAKAALGKDGAKSVLLFDLYGGLAEVQAAKRDWKGLFGSVRETEKIFKKMYDSVADPKEKEEKGILPIGRVDKLGPEIFEKWRDLYCFAHDGAEASGEKSAARLYMSKAAMGSSFLHLWRKEQALKKKKEKEP